jgi:hypothetical protein
MTKALLLALLSIRLMAGDWDAFEWLMGTWKAEGGGFTYSTDLDGKVLVRRNFAEARGTSHKDLVIHYTPARAIYFDNEGHVINYTVEVKSDGVVMLGDVVAGAPRFRFTYTKLGENRVGVKFEMAPPGKPDEFKMYVEGTAQRLSSKESPK